MAGTGGGGITTLPSLPPGRTFLRIAAEWPASAGLIGAESRYVSFANGCSGSLGISRLVPRDTPQIGRTLPVLLSNLPTGAAIMVFGWNALQPGLPLAGVGLPGCSVRVSLDAAVLLQGSGTEARYELPVPFAPALIGLRFHNQALVLDPGANPLGAVVSDAAAAIVGG